MRFISLGLALVVFYALLRLLGFLLDQALGMRCASLQTGFYWATGWVWLALIPFTIIYTFIRRFATKVRRWDILGPVGAVMVVFLVGVEPPGVMIVQNTLTDGRLAPLPGSASEVRTDHWSSLFSGETYVRFKAPPDQIEQFISNSPSLQGNQVTDQTPGGHYMDPKAPQWFAPSSGEPDWFRPPSDARGRMFKIPPGIRGHNDGGVMIDDDHQVVYAWRMWS